MITGEELAVRLRRSIIAGGPHKRRLRRSIFAGGKERVPAIFAGVAYVVAGKLLWHWEEKEEEARAILSRMLNH
uniref:Uncharacterized protein n=1 Tax=Oryza meridionalis TaxID=40149 RepID=A0A0E0EIR7_9ORYZ